MMRYIIFLVVTLAIVLTPNQIASKTIPGGYTIVEPPKFEEEQIYCLAQNIFYESLGEPYEGKLAVATVTMNRVRDSRFPNNICEVVFQRNIEFCQFSWTCGPRARFNQELFDDHYKIAEEFLTHNLEIDRLKNALFFHANYVNPNWDHFATRIEQIGNHIFYEGNV